MICSYLHNRTIPMDLSPHELTYTSTKENFTSFTFFDKISWKIWPFLISLLLKPLPLCAEVHGLFGCFALILYNKGALSKLQLHVFALCCILRAQNNRALYQACNTYLLPELLWCQINWYSSHRTFNFNDFEIQSNQETFLEGPSL